ncbi:hypothetical protein HZS61_012618 [Fusarium oxysporum f. sp. conglutinans]|uniref:RNA 3'-terminal phosphate cyclase domain-containing protein n=1 Tax=Fusarium oxysporum f. sp. conglutinans TaxID=100902 RepID=A0A8H6LL47_FUSOX|nr:hypothetical protein HZS61_012618 [Fusarium oxysporum f. sp. conglutinans]
MKPVELDGRTGEGGGQVVRVAIAIAALTGQAVTITNVRGNRERGGLKSQHVTSIQFLAKITDADVEGLSHSVRDTLRSLEEMPQMNLHLTH